MNLLLRRSSECIIRTKRAAERLIKRRFAIREDAIKLFDLQDRAHLVSSGVDKSDVLTRGRKVWIKMPLDAAKEHAMCNVEDGSKKVVPVCL